MTDTKRGADIVAEGLAAVGVKTIFTLSGNQIMPIFDAMIDVGIRLVHVRHEAAAVFMADAWSQLNNEIGVALLPAAPGFANGLAPLYSATCAESSVLLICGDSPISQDGMGAFQELDQVKIATGLTKFSKRSSCVDELQADIYSAVKTSRSGRPGPVHLALPQDLLQQTIDCSLIPEAKSFQPDKEEISSGLLTRIKNELDQAERPIILTGPALTASRTHDLHSKLIESLAAPVISMESPRGIKDPSMGNLASVLIEADLVLNLGKAIDFTLGYVSTTSFNPGCRFMIIDPESEMLERARRTLGNRIILSEQAGARGLAESLCTLAAGLSTQRQAWLHECASAIAERGKDSGEDNGTKLIHPVTLCRAVQRVLDLADDAVLVSDGGEFGQWAQAYTSAPSRIINGISGAIGGGICYAIGAKVSRPDATVIALMGDGTAGFHFSEFETAVRNNTPFIAVIGHDSRWNAEVQLQIREYGSDRQIGCELDDTRYDLAVQGLGGYGEYVTDPLELDAALQRAIDSGLPACINVRIEGLPAPSGAGH